MIGYYIHDLAHAMLGERFAKPLKLLGRAYFGIQRVVIDDVA
jgi:hypothetical protein